MGLIGLIGLIRPDEARLGPVGTAWDRLGPVGTAWDRLGPLGTAWDRLSAILDRFSSICTIFCNFFAPAHCAMAVQTKQKQQPALLLNSIIHYFLEKAYVSTGLSTVRKTCYLGLDEGAENKSAELLKEISGHLPTLLVLLLHSTHCPMNEKKFVQCDTVCQFQGAEMTLQ